MLGISKHAFEFKTMLRHMCMSMGAVIAWGCMKSRKSQATLPIIHLNQVRNIQRIRNPLRVLRFPEISRQVLNAPQRATTFICAKKKVKVLFHCGRDSPKSTPWRRVPARGVGGTRGIYWGPTDSFPVVFIGALLTITQLRVNLNLKAVYLGGRQRRPGLVRIRLRVTKIALCRH